MTFDVQHTLTSVQSAGFSDADAVAFDHASVAAASANVSGSYLFPIIAMRLAITAHTSGSGTLRIIQAGEGS